MKPDTRAVAHPHRRPPARGGFLSTTPWLRAPILLLRQPVVFLAIVGAAAILAVAAASGTLFLSTIGTASLHAQGEQSCPEQSRPGMTTSLPGDAVVQTARDGAVAMRAHGLRGSYNVALGQAQVQSSMIHLYARAGALAHVQRLTPSAGAGAWVPNTFAAKLSARPGDTIRTSSGKNIRVAGVYQDLAPDPFSLSHLPRYWCSWTNIIVSTVADDGAIAASAPDQRQGPVFLVDQATVARASDAEVDLWWYAPMSSTTHPLGAFQDAYERSTQAAITVGAAPDDHLQTIIGMARTAQTGITGSIVPIEFAGVIIAVLLMGGAGMFWANSRRREIRLLVARGVGPVPLAGKAVLETIVPAAVGAALGFGATRYLVRAVGPARVLEPGAPGRALVVVGATLLVGLLVIGVLGGLAGRERTTGRRTSWLVIVPWELALIGGAALIALARLDTSAVTIDHTIVRISALVVLYPLLGATGALLLLGRLIGMLLPSLGRTARRAPNAAYLALRRVSRSRAVAIGIIVGTALPCCLMMYASTVTDTVRREVVQKYQTNLGAPHVLEVFGVHGRLIDTHGHGTQVVVYEQNTVLGTDSGYVIGVDPATFTKYAFTTDTQRAAIRKLTPQRADGSIPAIIVNAGGNDSTTLQISSTHFALHPIAHTVVFPGMRNGAFPMVVVDQRVLSHIDNGTERNNQIWTDPTQYGAARHMVASYGFSVLFELTSKIVVDSTGLLPITWVFGYLQALAILIGVVAIAGLVFGLASRTRTRRVSYVLSRRMGMGKRAHLNSLLIELGLVIGVGWVAGSSLGLGTFAFVYRRLDVYPTLPPPASFALPGTPLVATAAVAAVVIAVATVATHALAERTRPAEILRLE